MSLLASLIFCRLFDTATAFPVLNETWSGQYTAWHSEPSQRGSFRLITGCLITLSLCVWTAVHLNVPEKTTTGGIWRRNNYALRRTRWVLIGLLAPELAVYTAWRQWSSARLLAQSINKINRVALSTEDKSSRKKWTLTHGFYAGMGGFVLTTDTKKNEEYIPNSPRLTLTAEGVLFLADHGYEIPWISEEEIQDRSKADGLAKLLVCLQAGYMIFQCLGRFLAKLPISLLEINTLGHVICALTMYLFWLNKPQDIHEPTELSISNKEWFCAFAWMCSPLSKSCYGEPGEISELCYYSGLEIDQNAQDYTNSEGYQEESEVYPSAVSVPEPNRCHPLRTHREALLPARNLPDPSTVVVHVAENEVLRGTRLGPANAKIVDPPKKLVRVQTQPSESGNRFWEPTNIGLDATSIRRWNFLSIFLDQIHTDLFKENELEVLHQQIVFRKQKLDGWKYLVVNEVPNWPVDAGLLSKSEELIWIVIAVVTAVYGSLHGMMWNSHFSTSAEKILWLISCIDIGTSGTLVGLGLLLDRMPYYLGITRKKSSFARINELVEESWLAFITWLFMFILWMSLLIPGAVAVLFYIPARIFIVLEAFLSLRYLPVEMYSTPNWTEWVPHL